MQAYSDHGVSVFSDDVDYIGENQTGAAWMLRGAGVPQTGIVDELTSALDIYPAAARLAGFTAPAHIDGNLPAVLSTHAVGQHIKFVPGRKHQIAQCILLFFALADVLALVEINLHKCCSLMAA